MDRFVQVLFYVGSIQGFLLFIFLFTLRVNRISFRLLGLLTFFWGLVILTFSLQAEGLYREYPHLLKTVSQLLFTFFPLIYLHVKYLLSSHDKFNLRDLWHFLPLALSLLFYADFYLLPAHEKLETMRNISGYYKTVQVISDEVIALQGIIYSILALRLISDYRRKVRNYQSNVDKVIIKVQYTGILLSLAAWVIGTIGINLELLDIKLKVDLFVYVYLIFVIIIYIISYVAIKTPEIFKLDSREIGFSIRKTGKNGDGSKMDEKAVPGFPVENALVEDKAQPNSDQVKLNKQLIEFIEREKPYLNPELSLQDLCQMTGMTRHQLSAVINQVHRVNFYEFINAYRVSEVKQLMKEPSNRNLKLISIAYDAGFNSKASFNRIFKQKTGITPSQYFEKEVTGSTESA